MSRRKYRAGYVRKKASRQGFYGFCRRWFSVNWPFLMASCLIGLVMYGNFVIVNAVAMSRQFRSKTMMFYQLTWQQFLVAAAVLTLVWYSVLFVSWYLRRRAAGGSGRAVMAQAGLPHRWEKGVDQLSEGDGSDDDDLMGKSQEVEGFRRVSASELRFAEAVIGARPGIVEEVNYPSVAVADQPGFLQGTVADFLEELKPVFDYAARYKKGLPVFLEHLQALVERYPEIRQSANWEAVVAHVVALVKEQLPFEVTAQQIQFFLEMGELEAE